MSSNRYGTEERTIEIGSHHLPIMLCRPIEWVSFYPRDSGIRYEDIEACMICLDIVSFSLSSLNGGKR
jgi:hypothetical protein